MKRKKTKLQLKLALLFILLSSVILSFGELVILRDSEHEDSLLRDSILSTGSLVSQEIQKIITGGIYITNTLASFLETENYSTDNFNNWGRLIMSSNQIVSTIELAPDGIVSYIYPLEGNEGSFGNDLLKDLRLNDGSLKAFNSGILTFVGPVRLMENGLYAVNIRRPIFIEESGEFWGFAIALILVDDILSNSFSVLSENSIHFKLEVEDSVNPILFESEVFNTNDFISMDISVPNGKWILSMSHEPIYNRYYNLLRVFLVIFSIVLSIFLYIQQIKIFNKSEEITLLNKKLYNLSMEDELTGAGNRRAGVVILDKLLSQSRRYNNKVSIILIDLDYFKAVNDNYGHQIGDDFLKYLVVILKSSIRDSDTIIRQGGDEFMILLPETGLKEAETVAQKIKSIAEIKPFKYKTTVIKISLSMGIAEFKDDKVGDDFIIRADRLLYKAKESGRNCYKS